MTARMRAPKTAPMGAASHPSCCATSPVNMGSVTAPVAKMRAMMIPASSTGVMRLSCQTGGCTASPPPSYPAWDAAFPRARRRLRFRGLLGYLRILHRSGPGFRQRGRTGLLAPDGDPHQRILERLEVQRRQWPQVRHAEGTERKQVHLDESAADEDAVQPKRRRHHDQEKPQDPHGAREPYVGRGKRRQAREGDDDDDG